MIFPKGEVVHKNLSTVYIDLFALLDTLKLEGFCGTIEMDFPEAKGFLFIDSGEIINGQIQTEEDTERVIGKEAVRTLLGFSKQRDGVLSIYRLPPEQVALIAKNLNQPLLFKELSTRFVRFDQFLQRLKEERLSGFIEVVTKERHPMGVLFFEEGEPIEMFTTPKTGASVFGRVSIPTFLENATNLGALFNVYGKKEQPQPTGKVEIEKADVGQILGKGAEEKRSEEGFDELLPLLQEFLSNSEKIVDTLSPKETFKKAFKKALIEKSEEFGFLDPFAGEFEYGNGTLRFSGEVGKEEFVKGFVESFRTTMIHLEDNLPQEKMVSLKMKAGIESFIETHRESLKRLAIEQALSSLTG